MTVEPSANSGGFVHPLAYCESETIGTGTRIWAFTQVMAGVQVGENCNIGSHAFLETGAVVGNRVTIKNHVLIWAGVSIEDDVFVGPGVIFTNDRYPRSPRRLDIPEVQHHYQARENWLLPTRVRRGSSLGAGAVILPGIEIGENAMVAAGSVVTRSVLPLQLVAGHPARPIGWVCQCGHPLPKPAIAVDWEESCHHCQGKYRSIKGAVHPVGKSANV